MTVAYVCEREQFKVKLATFQAVQQMVAVMALEIEGARHVTHQALWRLGTAAGRSRGRDREGVDGARLPRRHDRRAPAARRRRLRRRARPPPAHAPCEGSGAALRLDRGVDGRARRPPEARRAIARLRTAGPRLRCRACAAALGSPAARSRSSAARAHAVSVRAGFTATVQVTGLAQPTGAAFLPDGRLVVTEKGGNAPRLDRGGRAPRRAASRRSRLHRRRRWASSASPSIRRSRRTGSSTST
jgi:hypothetical protein